MTIPAPSADRFRRLGELFDAALALPSAQRAAFLRRACGTDVEMLAELEAMLRADDSQPTLAVAVREEARRLAGALAVEDSRLVPGARLGRYEIVAPLGAG